MRIGEASYIEFLLAGGLAEVKDGVMTILALEADAPGTVDSAAAAGEVVSAEVRLAQMSMFDPGYEDAAQALAVARVRAQVNQLLRAPH